MTRRWQDWAGLVAGIWLLVAPWALGLSSGSDAWWTTFGVGAGVALVAIWALALPAAAVAEWSSAALGVGLFVAPWTLAFTAETSAAWNAWILGAAVVILAAWSLLVLTGRLTATPGRRHRPAQ